MNYLFIHDCIEEALKKLKIKSDINYSVDLAKSIKFGDFATNIAMLLAKNLKQNPKVIAEKIANEILKTKKAFFSKVEVLQPGFINFFLNSKSYNKIILPFLSNKYSPTKIQNKFQKKINVEFVSANPTGSLHLGHVRNAYLGDVISKVFKAVGHKVNTEYWINDMGNQISLFEISVLSRYLQLFKIKSKFPEDGYPGKDPYRIAELLKQKFGDKYINTTWNETGIKDPKIRKEIWKFAIGNMLSIIKKDLASIGVKIQKWTSETKIYNSNIINKLMNSTLKKFCYEKEGAIWLKTTEEGADDKDRVLIKKDGTRTYFLTDIALQYDKKKRGSDFLFHVWGSDHEGHIKKMKLVMPMIGISPEAFEVVCIQMVKIEKAGQEVKLSKRAGTSITIPDMLSFINVDTSRWYILAQSTSSSIVIDLEKASKNDNSNPVYYVQYAHARICQLLKKNKLKNKTLPKSFDKLSSDYDRELINMLAALEPLLYNVAKTYEPHYLINYVHELAKKFHSWYKVSKVKDIADLDLQKQRYYLAKAVGCVISYVLNLLGINAPKQMKKL